MKVAVISLFYREYFFTNLWQKYYGDLFGFENLYAIGDIESDTSFKLFNSKVNFINYKAKYHADVGEHVQVILNIQKQLLEKYNVVIFAEADQYFIPDPKKYKDLKDYLFKNTQDYIKVSGWNVFQEINTETNYDYSKNILSQRKYWFKDPGQEDKMVIIRKPVDWYSAGFHTNSPDVERDPDLYNIHLHLFDFNICNTRRAVMTENKNWHPASGPNPGQCAHHVFLQDEKLKQEWFDRPMQYGITLIPEKFKILL
jgi:hypothetical protein